MEEAEQLQQETAEKAKQHAQSPEGGDGGDALSSPSSSSSSSSEDLLSDDGDDDALNVMSSKLEDAVKENPYNYQAHVEYLTALRKCGLLEKLRAARETMSSSFPLNSEMWQEWTQDEARLICSDKDFSAVEKLYERALQDYLSVELWQQYLEFMRHHDPGVLEYTDSGICKMRGLYERALSAASLHYTEGMELWEAYRQFEADVLASMHDCMPEVKEKQVNCIRSLYRRQLSVPMCNISATLREYMEWENKQGIHFDGEMDENGVPSKIASAYHKAEQMCKVREPLEEKISKDKTRDAEKLQSYLSYIALEEGTGDPARAQVLYERAVVEFPITHELWLNYLNYLENNLKVAAIIISVYGRAVRNCPWTRILWSNYLLALERGNKCESDVQKVFERSLQSGFLFSSAEEYLEHYLTRADGIRRRVHSTLDEIENQSLLASLRETFNQGVQFLSTYFPDFLDRTFRLHSYWARLEAFLAKDVSAARGVWENLIKSSGWMVEVWKGYIALEQSLGNLAQVRTVYKRCYSRRLEANGTEVICEEWLRFEREYGSLEDYDRAVSKVTPRLAEVKQLQEQDNLRSAAKLARDTKELHPEKLKPEKQARKKVPSIEEKRTPELKKRSFGDIGAGQEENPSRKRSKIAAVDAKVSEEKPGNHPQEHAGEVKTAPDKITPYRDECTAFVSRFGPEVTEKDLRDFFLDCEVLKEVRLMKDRLTGKSRCFAYVDFENDQGLAAAIAKNNQKLKGSKVKIMRSDPSIGRKKAAQQGFQDAEHGRLDTRTERKREDERATDSKSSQGQEEGLQVQAHNHNESTGSKRETPLDSVKNESKGGKGRGGRLNPISASHRRGGHLQLTGKNTFALPRSVVRPLGFTGGQVAKQEEEEPPKSNKDFREMLLK